MTQKWQLVIKGRVLKSLKGLWRQTVIALSNIYNNRTVLIYDSFNVGTLRLGLWIGIADEVPKVAHDSPFEDRPLVVDAADENGLLLVLFRRVPPLFEASELCKSISFVKISFLSFRSFN